MQSIPFDQLGTLEKIQYYNKINYEHLNMSAIFSDESKNFVSPIEPTDSEPVTIYIRTAKDNVENVCMRLRHQDYPMTISHSDELFDYFAVTLPCIKERIKYYFKIVKNDKLYYYNKRGLYPDFDAHYNFTVIPNFKIADWAKSPVMYQIYVDRFYNGDPSNDVVNQEYSYLGYSSKKIDDWNAPLENTDVCNFYGGDLQGVLDKMQYLKDLGIEVIYFNPVFVSPSNHKYDAQDYDYVDPHIGVIIEDGGEPLSFEKFSNQHATMYMQRTTELKNLEASNQLMIKLIETAHANGIRVILDGVFNHCGAFNKWLDKEGFYGQKGYPTGAFAEKDSEYHDYFKWHKEEWPNNNCYDGWWGHDNHPKLIPDASQKLYDYLMSVAKKWVAPPFNADGWRLDVAADLGLSQEFNHKFWKDFRKSVKEGNPDAVILSEHYGDPYSWLGGDEWDSVMNYDGFMEPLTWFLTGMEKHSESYMPHMLSNALVFENSMKHAMSRFSYQSKTISMNQLSNHDHSRFMTRTNRQVGRLHTVGADRANHGINKNVFMEAVVFQMTWPGAPTLYYGDEAGVCGWTDPDNRRTYPWGREDHMLINLHKEAIKIHKSYDCLREGSMEYLYTNYGILSFGRFTKDESIAVILNNNDVQKTLSLPIWKLGIVNGKGTALLSTGDNNFKVNEETFSVEHGMMNISLNPHTSYIILFDKK